MSGCERQEGFTTEAQRTQREERKIEREKERRQEGNGRRRTLKRTLHEPI